jgi:hypothetical protein
MYAHASINGKTVYMHRLILGACAGEIVDHRDGNGRNNSRENLRLCTGTQNNGNRRRQKTALAQFKGVTFDKQTGRWKSQLTIHGRNHHLGRFNSQEEAAVAYNSAARVHFGEFALLNGAP